VKGKDYKEQIELVKRNTDVPFSNEEWVVDFYDYIPLSFTNRQDLEKYLNHESSEEHGYMEWGRTPSGVTHIIHYDIVWK